MTSATSRPGEAELIDLLAEELWNVPELTAKELVGVDANRRDAAKRTIEPEAYWLSRPWKSQKCSGLNTERNSHALPPQRRYWHSGQTFAERDHFVVVIQDHARNKPFSGCFGQNSQSGKIGIRDGCCRLYFDTDDPPPCIFDDDIDFVLLLVSKMRKLEAGLPAAGEFKDLGKNESLQQRPELTPVVVETFKSINILNSTNGNYL